MRHDIDIEYSSVMGWLHDQQRSLSHAFIWILRHAQRIHK